MKPRQHLLHRVRLDGGVAVLVDQLGAVSVKDSADPVRCVAGLTDCKAERVSGLVAFLGRGQKEIPGPLVGQFLVPAGAAGRVHLRQVEADRLLEDVDAPDAGQSQRVLDRRRRDPVAVMLADIGH